MTDVLVVEDQVMPRQLFEIFIESSKNYRLVGSISNADLALSFCEKNHVDLILMDVCAALGSSGLDAAEKIKSAMSQVKIIIVTSMPEYSWLRRARNIGVDSFWYKDSDREPILSLMDRTMAGERIFPDVTPEISIGNITNHDFTDRELDILREITSGDSNTEIAKRLGISALTVKNHVQNLLGKTGFHSRTELATEVSRLGVVIRNR